MDVVPRMRTARPPSAVRVTVTPGNRPMRTFSIGSPGVRWMSSDVTVAVCAGLVRLAPLEWVHPERIPQLDRKSTRLNSSHITISYAVFCLKKKKKKHKKPKKKPTEN